MEVGVVTAPMIRGNRYFFSRREGNQNQPVDLLARGLQRRGPRPDRSGHARPVGPDDGRVVLARRNDGKTAGVRHLSRRRREHDAAPAGRRHRRACCRSRFPTRRRRAQWLPDDSGFVYQNLKNPKDPYSGQVLFHRMGTDPANDPVLFRQFTKAENEKLATTWGPFGSLSRDGHWLLLGYWMDTKSNDLWLVELRRRSARRARSQSRSSRVGRGRAGVRDRHRR